MAAEFKTLLDGWFGHGNAQLRTAIEQSAAIVAYRRQSSVPIVGTLVCDDAGQFKLLTDKLALCWPRLLKNLLQADTTKNFLQ